MQQLTELQQKIASDRYFLKDDQGRPIERSIEDVWARVAKGIASVERTNENKLKWETEFYRLLEDFKFVPGGRILAGAGTPHEVTMYNCFVIESPEDSRGGIFDSLKLWAEIQARGGGVGTNLSSLRPRGSHIKTVNGTASGPVSWAELYSVTTGDVIQQGGSRRGAAMLMLDDDHPDIVEFITAKEINPATNRPKMLEHANVSVAVSDRFIEAVKQDLDWQTQFPTSANYDGGPITYGPKYKARYLWDLICERAWATAEPGVIFIDRANRESNSWYYLKANSTNPCGEILLAPYHVCNLGALNLSEYVIGDISPRIDYHQLILDAGTAQRFLDNVIDASHYFLQKNFEAQMGTRRTGLGTMGLADMLIKLGVRYGSPESLEIIDKVYSTIRDSAYATSALLAKEKGAAPDFQKGPYLDGPFVKQLPEDIRDLIAKHGMRNISLLCVAPTGTTSLLAGTSSGVEPVFSFRMQRQDRTGTHTIFHPLADAYLSQHKGASLPDYFVATPDLTPDEHVQVQARVQRYIDQQISKTVNAPNDHTVESVKKLYMDAYDMGCKGITYYRDGSRDAVLTHVKEENGHLNGNVDPGAPGRGARDIRTATLVIDGEGDARDTVGDLHTKPQAILDGNTAVVDSGLVGNARHSDRSNIAPDILDRPLDRGQTLLEISSGIRPRPKTLSGYTTEIEAPEGDAHITVNSDSDGPLEVFVTVGRAGSDLTALSEAIGRLISLNLRLPSSMSPEERLGEIARQLRGIGGSRSVGFGAQQVRSLPDAIARVLDDHLSVETPEHSALDLCPKCHSMSVARQEGCKTCLSCSWSAC